MLLSNLTTTEAGSSSLLQLDTERLQGLHMAVLLKRLFTSGINYIEGQPDDYEHVASICEWEGRKEGRIKGVNSVRGHYGILCACTRTDVTCPVPADAMPDGRSVLLARPCTCTCA
jgi:hypothetical protein